MNNIFRFYEVVRVIPNSEKKLESIIGEEGTITGMCQDEHTNKWYYAVLINVRDEVWYVNEDHLESTGKMEKESNYKSGESIRVKVDPETGEGFLE